MKKCMSCGALQDDANKFCSSCGSSNFTSDLEQAPVTAAPVASKKRSGMKWIPFLLGGIAGLIIALVIVVSCIPDPVEKVMLQIRDEDFSSAAQVYEDKIKGDDEKLQEVYDQVAAYVDELMEQYRGDSISYDDLSDKLTSIDEMGILGSQIEYALEEAGHLDFLRRTYAEAEKEYENGNYRYAMDLYIQVAYSDFEHSEDALHKYEQCIESFRDAVIAEADGYIESGEYSLAMMLLEDALTVLPDDPSLLATQQKCIKAEYDAKILAMRSEAQLYVLNNDHVAALDYLDLCIAEYPDELLLQQERSSCLAEYEKYVIEESIRLANEGEYKHALSLTEAGLSRFESLKVTELAMIYKSHIPVILGEMEMFKNATTGGSWASKTDETNVYLEDNYGNTYDNSLSVGTGSVIYLVNFKYQTFEGTVAFPKGLESDSYRSSATLTIYGDGEKIAEFVAMDQLSKPIPFSVDISSYEKITLKWSCDGANIWHDWGEFATIFDGLLTPIPMEIPSEA